MQRLGLGIAKFSTAMNSGARAELVIAAQRNAKAMQYAAMPGMGKTTRCHQGYAAAEIGFSLLLTLAAGRDREIETLSNTENYREVKRWILK